MKSYIMALASTKTGTYLSSSSGPSGPRTRMFRPLSGPSGPRVTVLFFFLGDNTAAGACQRPDIGIFVFPFAFLDTTFCSKIKETILKIISCKCDLSQRSEFMRDTGVTIILLSLESVGDEKMRRGGEEERKRGREEERRRGGKEERRRGGEEERRRGGEEERRRGGEEERRRGGEEERRRGGCKLEVKNSRNRLF